MKTEVLKSIKETEAQCKSTITAAQTEREQILANARLEADNLIAKATTVAEDYKKQRLSDARNVAAAKHAAIVEQGKAEADATIVQGSKKLPQAASLFVERFKEKLHVSA
ncbi:MAG: ATPase [Methanocorpusculum sp.]|uniref:ATPase n=1 Tax=Methanocorpusculum petauri TaxID=3002863 RepID=A0ABT4IGC4_9EURY|nr:ATPase [Methanocorpusculum petauri]MDE2444424.1 ATPase [Methanocorpusculum sp.]MCZ0860611.1 ATPase [Methanocorpusculum petauri]MDE2519067.1 ATPase [Methanocorpusculum sp.]MDE2523269.1 ATPase [Methanocorpusculum sp.]MDE2523978.1 ATPase [Methanocorpusculum sp.]